LSWTYFPGFIETPPTMRISFLGIAALAGAAATPRAVTVAIVATAIRPVMQGLPSRTAC
jgi:hypothetical protein